MFPTPTSTQQSSHDERDHPILLKLVLRILRVLLPVFRRVRRLFRVFRGFVRRLFRHTRREVVRTMAPKPPTVELTVVILFVPRVLPNRRNVRLTFGPPLVGTPLLPLPRKPLAAKTTSLVRPTPLTPLCLVPLVVVPRLVLVPTWPTLLLSKLDEVLTWTSRLPFAVPLPVDMPKTLPVLTLKAILTRGIL